MKHTESILALIAAACLWAGPVRGQPDPISFTISATNFVGDSEIPNGFTGFSCGMSGYLLYPYDPYPAYHALSGEAFDPTNAALMTLIEQIGIRHVRMGWGTGDATNLASLLTTTEVDKSFQFFQQARINAIFSLDQLIYTNTPPPAVTNWMTLTNYDDGLAQHVWTNYQANLDDFAIGNEPDESDYTNWFKTYAASVTNWDSIADSVTNICHGATFAAPDAGGVGVDWGTNFPNSEKNAHRVDMYTQHQYPGGPDKTNITSVWAVTRDLSPGMLSDIGVSNYPGLLSDMGKVISDGYPYRFDECEDFGHGITNASDAFGGGLWALDFLHWWANHVTDGCVGADLINSFGFPNCVLDYVHGLYYLYPKGYALKAWDLGGHGYIMPISNSNNVNDANDTFYAVGNGQDLYVTLINKQAPSGGKPAAFTITPSGFPSASVSAIYMQSTHNDLYATNDTLLGQAVITNNAQWQGMWSNLPAYTGGGYSLTLNPAQACVLHFRAGSAYSTPIQINNDGLMEIFTANPSNGHLYHLWQVGSANAFANWNGTWADMGVLASGSPNVTNIAGPCVIKNLDGTLEIFASGSDGNVYYSYQTAPRAGWSSWSNLGGPGVTNLEAQLNPDGGVNLFGIGNNGDIVYNSQIAPGITNLMWNDMGATTSGSPLQPGFAVSERLNGCLEVFAVDASGNLWWNTQNTNSNWNTWTGWNEVSGVTLNPWIQVNRSNGGLMGVYGIDASSGSNKGGIDFNDQNLDNSWGTWNTTSVPPPNGTTVQPGFAMAIDANGDPDLIVVGADANVYHNSASGGVWSDWSSLGGSGSDPHVAVGNSLGGAVQAFVIGSGNNVWSAWQSTPDSTTWQGWGNFGGSGQIFYPGQP